MNLKNINLSIEQISIFRDRWHRVKFSLFGSVPRDDFRHSDDCWDSRKDKPPRLIQELSTILATKS